MIECKLAVGCWGIIPGIFPKCDQGPVISEKSKCEHFCREKRKFYPDGDYTDSCWRTIRIREIMEVIGSPYDPGFAERYDKFLRDRNQT